jgi:predicted nucleic acid-binding protein
LEVQPTTAVRDRALRLLRVHALRAADAFQLAAALIACEEQPRDSFFYTGDQRLAAAAQAEGFTVPS